MKTKTYVIVIMAASMLALSINACSKSSTSPQQQPGGGTTNNKTINIVGMAFPASTTVKKGATVTWHNSDAFAHTVTSDDGTTFSSGNMGGNASFTYVANTAGTFDYHCNIHQGMTGTLIVQP
ncbi:MAG: cupredoxin domain-containing protein [Ginsengibacter sp.]